MMNDLAAIECQGLTKRFRNGVLANDAIDLTVPAGTIFGLLGPNGAGKTTLVRQLTGELLPTSGNLRVLGHDVVRQPLLAKALMGIVPQEAAPFDNLTPAEHLQIFGQLHGLSRQVIRERTDQLLQDLDLSSHRSKRTMELSGGLKRKLLIGMAIIARPRVLVLDEPTTGLDPNSRRDVWAMIRSLQQDGAAVLLTTHYMEEAEALCSQVAILAQGKIVAAGSIEQIRALSRRRFKASYEVAGEVRSLFGETHEEVAAIVERLGLAEYAVSKASLEDLYLELTAREVET